MTPPSSRGLSLRFIHYFAVVSHVVGASDETGGSRMSNKLRRRPSPALVISIVALVLAASGTAVAASKLVSGDSLIKKDSLSGNRLKNGSVTGKEIAAGTLGKVPDAAKADSATTAGSAAISNVTYVTTASSVSYNSSPALVTATCPAGTTVIGGGGNVADETSAAYVNDSFPSGKTGWSVNFDNANYQSPTSVVSVSVTAICAPAAATAP
jgi:hypothetical protein